VSGVPWQNSHTSPISTSSPSAELSAARAAALLAWPSDARDVGVRGTLRLHITVPSPPSPTSTSPRRPTPTTAASSCCDTGVHPLDAPPRVTSNGPWRPDLRWSAAPRITHRRRTRMCMRVTISGRYVDHGIPSEQRRRLGAVG